MDQTSWMAEVAGLHFLATAWAMSTQQATIQVAIDCLNVVTTAQAVIRHIRDGDDLVLPAWGYQAWETIMQLFMDTNVSNITLEWIPSHDKYPNWQPTAAGSGGAGAWRYVNDQADHLAKAAAKRHASLLDYHAAATCGARGNHVRHEVCGCCTRHRCAIRTPAPCCWRRPVTGSKWTKGADIAVDDKPGWVTTTVPILFELFFLQTRLKCSMTMMH